MVEYLAPSRTACRIAGHGVVNRVDVFQK